MGIPHNLLDMLDNYDLLLSHYMDEQKGLIKSKTSTAASVIEIEAGAMLVALKDFNTGELKKMLRSRHNVKGFMIRRFLPQWAKQLEVELNRLLELETGLTPNLIELTENLKKELMRCDIIARAVTNKVKICNCNACVQEAMTKMFDVDVTVVQVDEDEYKRNKGEDE